MNLTHGNLRIAIEMTEDLLLTEGKPVNTSSWQGKHLEDGSLSTIEVTNVHFTVPVPPYLADLKELIRPNLPWADEHFAERVSHIPYNPPPSHVRWPFWRASSEETKEVEGGLFSHTYPERFWPPSGFGIRYSFGNLDDVVNLLIRDPLTRQANFSIWSMEDTGAKYKGRVPCTLNYFFLCREGKLNIFYDIRSCDVLRHFKDDVYLACRLLLWVLDELQSRVFLSDVPRTRFWRLITPGTLTMHIYSLHMFTADKPVFEYRRKISGKEK